MVMLLGLWERAVHKMGKQWSLHTPVGPGSPEWQRWGGIWRVGRRTSSNSGTENTAGRSDWGGRRRGSYADSSTEDPPTTLRYCPKLAKEKTTIGSQV